MRINGTFRIETETETGVGNVIDEYGEPTGSEQAWSAPVPCSVVAVSDTRLGRYEDGEMHQASYTVLVEASELLGGDLPEPSSIRRISLERRGCDLGEMRVISLEVLETLGRVRITV